MLYIFPIPKSYITFGKIVPNVIINVIILKIELKNNPQNIKKMASIINIGLKPHTEISQIINSIGWDGHAWIEHNGKIIDYSDDVLRNSSLFSTPHCDIIRRPFPEKLQDKIKPILVQRLNHKIKKLRTMPKQVQKDIMKQANHGGGLCFWKATKYKQKNPDAVIVIGSLGFKCIDGKIRYEYG